MKASFTLIILGIFAILFPFNSVFASCTAEVNYSKLIEESQIIFKGTVVYIDNSPGPQQIHFDVHEVSKGEIPERYILKNLEFVNFEDNSVTTSSINVDYKVGTTYNVYVIGGMTSMCTTKPTAPVSGYVLPKVVPPQEKESEIAYSYELDEPICIGGPGTEYDEDCMRVESYDPYQEDEEMRMASEKVIQAEESMGFGSGTAIMGENDIQTPLIAFGAVIGMGTFAGLLLFWRRK